MNIKVTSREKYYNNLNKAMDNLIEASNYIKVGDKSGQKKINDLLEKINKMKTQGVK